MLPGSVFVASDGCDESAEEPREHPEYLCADSSVTLRYGRINQRARPLPPTSCEQQPAYTMTQRPSAADRCEDFLRRERSYNVEHKIWPSENRVIDRMLGRGAELDAVYGELWSKLEPEAVERFLSIMLDVGTVWHPGYLSAARKAYGRQVDLKREIFELANELAALLRERTELGEFSGFHTTDAYHIVDVIERADDSNGHFSLHLRRPLSALRHRFDLKYWPSVADLVDAMAADALDVDIYPSDAITEAGTRSPRRSKADSFRALQSALEEHRRSSQSLIGEDFRLSDEGWATILNVMLDRDPDKLVDGPYIKRLRQRDRNAGRDEPNVD